MRVNTTVAAYAQLRHNHVLLAAQSYGEGGCQIPDGYVEPAPEVYDALARYAALGERQIGKLSPDAAARDYFARLGTIARVLAAISRIELAGQPLPLPAQQFLGMVSEIEPYGSDGRPTYTGWYFDLFLERTGAMSYPDLVADYVTTQAGVGYIGTQRPVLAIFAVDAGGGPRAMIGPVARAYEHWGGGRRLDDAAAARLPQAARQAPWAASYTAPAPPAPAFDISFDGDDEGHRYLLVEAPRALGAMTIEEYDHHRVAIQRVTRRIAAGKTRIPFELKYVTNLPVIHVQVGRWHGWTEVHCGDGCRLTGFE
jgi:hypothetical protein